MREQDDRDKVMKKGNKRYGMIREVIRAERKKDRTHRRRRGGGHRCWVESRWGRDLRDK